MKTSSLKGVRIWLSAALPDDATPEEALRVRDFVSAFARAWRLVCEHARAVGMV
jgi:hypothetical protein